MADVAILLHWPPSSMDPMALGELMQWRTLAVERHNAMHADPNSTR